ncbi:hypothetical protein PUN28_010744 [Cardiocondyla obscurior]|uniref:Uncharacterized protein n=1 Tax=Cardiocondyla obscurior TaxID=286306 RepID=A0AAW2FJ25_9HYME
MAPCRNSGVLFANYIATSGKRSFRTWIRTRTCPLYRTGLPVPVWEPLPSFYRAFSGGEVSYKVRLELWKPPSAPPIRPRPVINRAHPLSTSECGLSAPALIYVGSGYQRECTSESR